MAPDRDPSVRALPVLPMSDMPGRCPRLSIVVVAHEMARELPRTLESLSTNHQRDIARDDYEVLLVDNGSRLPPQERDFDDLELNLRCLRLPRPHRSPVGAINLGLSEAQGGWVAVWIDGARMASPRLLATACEALHCSPRTVVGVRGRYLGHGVQSETMLWGYSQAAEDRLLERCGWRVDGYRLFGVSVFDESSGPTWFDPPTECNALFMSRQLWTELGGYDTRFASAGGGLVNLDTWSRAIALPGVTPVVLLGEATFHQFHDGTMTNAPDQMERWRACCAEYESIRGRPWRWPATPLRFWGTFAHSPPRGELVRCGGAWHGLKSGARLGLNRLARTCRRRHRPSKGGEPRGAVGMTRRCILHVGAAKTGTTSLQRALCSDLQDPRFMYVSGDSANGSFAITAAFETAPRNEWPFRAANLRGDFATYRERQIRLLAEGFAAAQRTNRDMVISSEESWLSSRECLLGLREALLCRGFAVEVVAYVRPWIPWIHSLFQQYVRMGRRDLDLGSRRDMETLGVREQVSKFHDVFGRGNVEIRLFMPERFPDGCIVRDFCQRLGWSVDSGLSWHSNESLNLPALQLLYAYNRFSGKVGENGPPIPRRYGELPGRLAGLPGPAFRLHSRLLRPFLSRLQADDPWIEKEFGFTLSADRLPRDEEHSIASEGEMFRYAPETLDWLARETGERVLRPGEGETAARAVAAQVEILRSRLPGSWSGLVRDWWPGFRPRWVGQLRSP